MPDQPENTQAYYFSDTSFNLLMQKRIRKVLVICSRYDFYMLEEDGRIDEQIFNEYVSLNLRYPPVFVHADSAKKASEILKSESIDLIIEMLSISDTDSFQLAKNLKKDYPGIPIVILTHFSREVSLRLEREDLSAIDHVFCWLGNVEIFLAIIKLLEDSMNASNDILKVGVQAILLVEDSIRFISSYLPSLYRIILEQSKEYVKEALNEHQQMLRRRGRPKILLAKNYNEAVSIFNKYHKHILGVISDVSYKISPTKRDTKTKAGLKFCELVQGSDRNIPFLLQSSDTTNRKYADELEVGFIHKYSKNLSNELRDFILKNFGFGEFLFRDPETREVKFVAQNLKALQELILSVPDDILKYHTERDDISKWLNARALFPIAQHFKVFQYDDFKSPDDVRKFIYNTIASFRVNKARGIIAEFNRENFDEYLFFSRIGKASLGGKARGLAFMASEIKKAQLMNKYSDVVITVPPTVVLSTDIFEQFLEDNNLYKVAISSGNDEEILNEFLKGSFPGETSDDLMAIASIAKRPLAVRSSSKLEDSLFQPFAGIYNTYMIPPHGNARTALFMLERAIKCVYASVFFGSSKAYMAATSNLIDEEKMGIIIQSVCGNNYDGRYYPTLSGVARSLNYYPIGSEKSEDGIVELAYGLGKQIVEGGISLRFSPKYPQKCIQLSSPAQALKDTQKYYYALDMDPEHFVPSVDDKLNLFRLPVKTAEKDSSFKFAASTYDITNAVIRDGLIYEGKRIITFSNILNHNAFPLAPIITDLLALSSGSLNNPVEIEFAADLDVPDGQNKIFNYLQVRPIVSIDSGFDVNIDSVDRENTILYSGKAMGNGRIKGIKDIVYIRTETYKPANNKAIASELEKINLELRKQNVNYVLIGPGRWGSGDPWLGIPVKWAQISSVRLMVEMGLEHFKVEPSQGTHFFHNLTSFGVGYFTVNPSINDGIFNIKILDGMPAVNETENVRHVKFDKALHIEIDGRNTQGVIYKG
ncbi:MAG: phosphoenolpyruvate synthase [Bacteroidales bacterium]|nr:phosphoenolpyruvate synthase [Bacteroidales bacterium]